MAESQMSNSTPADRYLEELKQRRAAIQAQYDAILKEPQSYSVSGSVSATNRSLKELREELAAVDAEIAQHLGMSGPGGMRRRWPRYVR